MMTELKIGFESVDTIRLLNMCAELGAKTEVELIGWALTFYETCMKESERGNTIVSIDKNNLEYDIPMLVIPMKPE